MHYLKYQIKYGDVYSLMNSKNYKNMVIYLDLAGISKGFYSTSVIRMETAGYAETRNMPTTYFSELKTFLSNLYAKFAQYNPKFVLFFDGGQCQQNVGVDNCYKADRRSSSAAQRFLVEEEIMNVFKLIKSYYYSRVEELFTIPGYCSVIDLKEYESDLVPYYIRLNGLLNSSNDSTCNLVIALDKDLLQGCAFSNMYQATSIYHKAKRFLDMRIYDDETAIEYIYPKFKRGILTSKYISTILSISGDKADNVPGVQGYGPAKAISIIMRDRIDHKITKDCRLPKELEKYRDRLIKNYKMINFEEQISRLPINIIEYMDRSLK